MFQRQAFSCMTRKQWLLLGLVALLGGLSLYLNRDWFANDNIHIYHRSRPAQGRLFGRIRPEMADISPIVFGFDRKLKLTCLKVIPLSDIQTNKHPHPIWHLVSESNSVPIKDFLYGQRVQGMHPAIREATPDPLEPGVGYRLLVEAGAVKAEHDFVPVPR
jgi:hypothetical protein